MQVTVQQDAIATMKYLKFSLYSFAKGSIVNFN